MKRKGFTLIELLAVIVILAIIALISVPIQIKNGTKFKAISAGSNHSLAIDVNDELWGFGYIGSGVTKNNSAVINTPIKVNFNF